MFTLRDIEEFSDQLSIGYRDDFVINGVNYTLIRNEVGSMLIRTDVLNKALDDKIKQELDKYEVNE
jgi:hypothetical protein